MPVTDTRMAEYVRKLRKTIGSAERLAASIGRQSSTVWAYERGRFEPSPDIRMKLAEIAREHGLEELARAFEAEPEDHAPATIQGLTITRTDAPFVELMLEFVRCAPAGVVEIETRRLGDYVEMYGAKPRKGRGGG